jgi:hypothetical protein
MFARKLSVTREDFEKWQKTLLESNALTTPADYDAVFAKW